MTNRMPITCTRCNATVGMAKISVPLHSGNSDLGQPNMRLVIADQDDLEYWQKQHSEEECNTEIDRIRAKVATVRAAQGEANAQG